MKVATHVGFAECCWFATSAVVDVQYAIPEVLAVGAASLIPDADYPRSWLGYRLGRVSKDLNRLFGHRSFLHSLLALVLVGTVLGLPMWWIAGNLAPVAAIFVGYGSHLVADVMSVGGVQLFWPNRAIAVFPGRDDYRVVSGSGSERVFVIVVLVLALLFYPVSRLGFDGLIYRLGGADQVYGKKASDYTERELTDRVVRLEIPRIGDSEDAYGRTLAYVYLDTDEDGEYEHLFNEDLIELGLARTTTFSHAYRREFERLREEAEERGIGLWSACPEAEGY